MAYTTTEWKDHIVEHPNRYRVVDNGDGTVDILDEHGAVIQQGTPVDATRLNKIEQGIKDAHDAIAAHLNDYAQNAIKTTGDWTMTGRLTFPSYELTNTELVIQHGSLIFPGNPNEKLDIEIPKASINGTLEISVISEWNNGNASGTLTKVIHFSTIDDGTIALNNSYYSDASPYTANHYAISDLIFDPIKDKFVVKIAHRSTSSTTVKIVVKARGARNYFLSILKQITFSPIYTTDPTIYDQPYRTGVIVSSGSNANGHYVRWANGLQICYGLHQGTNTPQAGQWNYETVTFPASFYDDSYTVTLSYFGFPGLPHDYWQKCAAENRTTTGFRITEAVQQNATNALRYFWIAVGRWK